MVIEATCSACGHPMRVPAEKAGELVKCVYCGALTRVATSAAPPPVVQLAAAGDPAPEVAPAATTADDGAEPPGPPPIQEPPALGGGLIVVGVVLIVAAAWAILTHIGMFLSYTGTASRRHPGAVLFLADALTGLAAWGYVVVGLIDFFQRRRIARRRLSTALTVNVLRVVALFVISLTAAAIRGGFDLYVDPVMVMLLGSSVVTSVFALSVVAYLSKSRRALETLIRD